MSATSSNGFSSKLGYVLAAAGSAVGLGNIWRFPYLAAKYGGGIFLLTYLILVLTFGYSLMFSENCLGRMTRKGPIGAYRAVTEGKSAFIRGLRVGGWLNAIIPMMIVPYYCVIGGWVTKYIFAMACNPVSMFSKDNILTNEAGVQLVFAGTYFESFITSTWQPLMFFGIFVAMMVLVIAFGVENGIERFSKIVMPMLLVLVLGICVYCLFLPNASEGLKYYLKPDLNTFNYMTVVNAMGQLFYSLSIGMGIMITYGSYMRDDDDLVANINHVELFDTGIAFLAGLMIIPAVVAFGGKEAAEKAGPGLLFIIMPQVFANFAGGRFVGILFFILVFFAALTSAISLLETNVHTVSQEVKISRRKAIAICSLEVLFVGTITVLGYSVFFFVHPLAFIESLSNLDILDSLDYASNNILMPVAAIFTTVLMGAAIGIERICSEIKKTSPKWHRQLLYKLCMRFIVIPCLLIVLAAAIGVI